MYFPLSIHYSHNNSFPCKRCVAILGLGKISKSLELVKVILVANLHNFGESLPSSTSYFYHFVIFTCFYCAWSSYMQNFCSLRLSLWPNVPEVWPFDGKVWPLSEICGHWWLFQIFLSVSDVR